MKEYHITQQADHKTISGNSYIIQSSKQSLDTKYILIKARGIISRHYSVYCPSPVFYGKKQGLSDELFLSACVITGGSVAANQFIVSDSSRLYSSSVSWPMLAGLSCWCIYSHPSTNVSDVRLPSTTQFHGFNRRQNV